MFHYFDQGEKIKYFLTQTISAFFENSRFGIFTDFKTYFFVKTLAQKMHKQSVAKKINIIFIKTKYITMNGPKK